MDFIIKEGEFRTALQQKASFTDEDDKKIYELYKTGGIDYLITGNIKHFPREKGIILPRDLLEIL